MKKGIMWIGLVLLLAMVFFSGCTSKEPVTAQGNVTEIASSNSTVTNSVQSSTNTTVTPNEDKVQFLDLGWSSTKNWDADVEVDGIETDILPKDSKEKVIPIDGIVSAKLYRRVGMLMDVEKGEILQEWDNINIARDNFGYNGAELHLEFSEDFIPTDYTSAWLEIKLVLSNGKEFNAKDEYVFLD